MNLPSDQRVQKLQQWLDKHYAVYENSFTPVSGDASFRRYFRFIAKNTYGEDRVSLIAVDAPPELENSQPFIDVAKLLLKNKLPVPKIYQSSIEQGYFVIEDFGDQLLLDALNKTSADYLYGLAISYLLKIQLIKPDTLPLYDSALLQNEMHLFSDWYLEKHYGIVIDDDTRSMLKKTYSFLESNALEQPQVFVHRDYHSRNLMILGADKVGIIDFQDAVTGPISYDLVSLLRDCYIDWPQTKINQWIGEYYSCLPKRYAFTEQQFRRWFDLMGVQRHLKAIGIFSRLKYRDGKDSYINDIPRTLNYVMQVGEQYDELKALHSFLRTIHS